MSIPDFFPGWGWQCEKYWYLDGYSTAGDPHVNCKSHLWDFWSYRKLWKPATYIVQVLEDGPLVTENPLLTLVLLLQLRTDDCFKQNKVIVWLEDVNGAATMNKINMIRSNCCACPPIAYFSGSKYDGRMVGTISWHRLRTEGCADIIRHQSWK